MTGDRFTRHNEVCAPHGTVYYSSEDRRMTARIGQRRKGVNVNSRRSGSRETSAIIL